MKFIPGDNTDIYVVVKTKDYDMMGYEHEYIGYSEVKSYAEAVAKHLDRREGNPIVDFDVVPINKLGDYPLGEHKEK